MKSNIRKFYGAIDENNMTGEQVADLFVNFLGTQVLEDDFIEFIKDEGFYIEE